MTVSMSENREAATITSTIVNALRKGRFTEPE